MYRTARTIAAEGITITNGFQNLRGITITNGFQNLIGHIGVLG